MAIIEKKFYCAHSNIYSNIHEGIDLVSHDFYNRKIRVDIGLPSNGINKKRG